MPFPGCKKIWLDGEFVDFEDAKFHILSHVIHYGSGVFEGERCYNTVKGPAVFRLNDHSRRLLDSAKIYRMTAECNPVKPDGTRMFPEDKFLDYSVEDIKKATLDTIRMNGLDNCYVRPLIFRGDEALGVSPFTCTPHLMIAVWKWGKYLGADAIERGVDVQFSSWTRIAPNTFPGMAKACGNYLNSQLIKMEALINGYVDGIALDKDGFISEGSAMNVFVIKYGKIFTPPIGGSELPGITRDSVIKLALDMGYEVVETRIPREMVYIADEAFFTGSAAEVSPIASVDRIPVGKGSRGEVTREIQERFFGIVQGKLEDKFGWLTFV
jgi:branched-chain amino acid aminotransferase